MSATKQTTSPALESLSQSDAAWLIDRRASWLRDRPNLVRRNPDGTYPGRELVRAMLGTVEPATLDDEHLTAVLRITECVYELSYAAPGVLRILTEIRDQHGTAGLAAVGQVLLETVAGMQAVCPPAKTAAEIRARHKEAADAEIADLACDAAARDMRVVTHCGECGKYRWGSKWMKGELPKGYIRDDCASACPEHF